MPTSRSPSPHHWLSRLCCAMALCVAVPAFAQAADDPGEFPLTLEFFAVIPASPNSGEVLEESEAPDPTIVPYSGWHYFAADGTPQPWRRRAIMPWHGGYVDGGQSPDFFGEPRMLFQFHYPEADTQRLRQIDFAGEVDWDFYNGHGSSGSGDETDEGMQAYDFETHFESFEGMPEQLSLELEYELTEGWQTILHADADSEFPVEAGGVRIDYFGPVRPDSPGNAQYISRFGPPDQPFVFECQTTLPNSGHNPDYRIRFLDANGEPVNLGNGSQQLREGSLYTLSRREPSDFARVEIQHTPTRFAPIDPIDLSPVSRLRPEQLVQSQIELTPEHRFGPAERIAIQPQTEDATACLVDLDQAQAMHLPFAAPRGDALALLLEEHGIDLVIRMEHGRLIADSAGFPLYPIPEQQWGLTPLAIVNTLRASEDGLRFVERTAHVAEDGYLALCTTCDGTMLLMRFRDVRIENGGQVGRAILEIRRLEAP